MVQEILKNKELPFSLEAEKAVLDIHLQHQTRPHPISHNARTKQADVIVFMSWCWLQWHNIKLGKLVRTSMCKTNLSHIPFLAMLVQSKQVS